MADPLAELAAEQPDPFREGGPLEAAYAASSALDLPLPPLPGPFLALIDQPDPGRAFFTSRPDLTTLADLDALVEGAAAEDVAPYVAFGHEGRGVNQWFYRYALVLPGGALFVELRLGGIYGDPEAAEEVRVALGHAERLAAVLYAGAGPRVVAVHRDADRRWAVLGGRRIRWRESNVPLADAASASREG